MVTITHAIKKMAASVDHAATLTTKILQLEEENRALLKENIEEEVVEERPSYACTPLCAHWYAGHGERNFGMKAWHAYARRLNQA